MYDSLDMPAYYWVKVHDSADLSYLLIKRKKPTKTILEKLQKVWEKIYNEYLQEFGFSEAFVEIQEKKIQIAQFKIALVLTGDRINETEIELAEQELLELEKGMGKSNFMQAKMAIEKHFKFQINMMTTTAREFNAYLKDLK